MLDCLIVGDSIAVGTHQFSKHCAEYAKGGINSWQWNNLYKNKELVAKTVVISLGSNDHKHIKTQQELIQLRQRVDADKVFWILPAGNLKASEVPIEKIQRIVQEISDYYGDTVLPITSLQADGIHPSWAGYKDIVNRTKGN